MFILGIVLIVLAVLFGLGVSVSSTASTKLEVFGVDFGVSVPTVFFLGAAAGAILVAGMWLMKKGLGRGWRRRKEMRALRAQAATAPAAPAVPAAEAPVGPEPVASERVGSDRVGSEPVADTSVGGEITEGDSASELPTGTAAAADRPGDERLAVEQELAPDPSDTKQPH